MHRTDCLTTLLRWARPMVVATVAAGVLVACGTDGAVPVRAGAVAAPGVRPPAPPAAPVSIFQGEVTSVDGAAAEVVVAAHLEWAPGIGPLAESRTVALGPATAWQPPDAGPDALHVGQEVQVKAVRGSDGAWVGRRSSCSPSTDAAPPIVAPDHGACR